MCDVNERCFSYPTIYLLPVSRHIYWGTLATWWVGNFVHEAKAQNQKDIKAGPASGRVTSVLKLEGWSTLKLETNKFKKLNHEVSLGFGLALGPSRYVKRMFWPNLSTFLKNGRPLLLCRNYVQYFLFLTFASKLNCEAVRSTLKSLTRPYSTTFIALWTLENSRKLIQHGALCCTLKLFEAYWSTLQHSRAL